MLSTLIASSTIKDRGTFESTWDTTLVSTGSSLANQIKLPTVNGGVYNFSVDWGDGIIENITAWNDTKVTHTYTTPGIKQLKIKGVINSLRFANTGDKLKISSIERWGCFRVTYGAIFDGCANLKLNTVVDVLNTSGATSFDSSFRACSSLTTVNRINEWDVSKFITMNSAFSGCTLFNSNINTWNTSLVTNFNGFLYLCAAFNQELNNISFVSCSTASLFLAGKSAASYNTSFLDNILISMANQPLNNTGWAISFGTLKRTAASTPARDFLTKSVALGGRALTITDGGI